jgi:hypothetical protein
MHWTPKLRQAQEAGRPLSGAMDHKRFNALTTA